MRQDDREIRVERHGDLAPHASGTARDTSHDTSLGELFRQLSTDTGDLIRKEAALAKAEMREVGATLTSDAKKLGIAAGLGLVGTLALTAGVILVLGNLFGGAYWLSALLVGAVAVGAAIVLARNAVNDVRERGLRPEQTIATLREDKAWASQQAKELKHDLTTDPTAPPTRR